MSERFVDNTTRVRKIVCEQGDVRTEHSLSVAEIEKVDQALTLTRVPGDHDACSVVAEVVRRLDTTDPPQGIRIPPDWQPVPQAPPVAP